MSAETGVLSDLYPPLGLVLTAGSLRMTTVSDEDIPGLVELALDGIHEPDQMPFYFPWSTAPREDLGRNMAQFYWLARAEFSRANWTLNLAVRHEGELVGCQDLVAMDFRVTRTAESGSWLAARHHGRAIGTAMRQAVCAFAFDHLGATEVTSGAFLDNPASLAVSEKVGYQKNGLERRHRRTGELAHLQRLSLFGDYLVRGEELTVEGVETLQTLLGLD